jgi:hypothetical protein
MKFSSLVIIFKPLAVFVAMRATGKYPCLAIPCLINTVVTVIAIDYGLIVFWFVHDNFLIVGVNAR